MREVTLKVWLAQVCCRGRIKPRPSRSGSDTQDSWIYKTLATLFPDKDMAGEGAQNPLSRNSVQPLHFLLLAIQAPWCFHYTPTLRASRLNCPLCYLYKVFMASNGCLQMQIAFFLPATHDCPCPQQAKGPRGLIFYPRFLPRVAQMTQQESSK